LFGRELAGTAVAGQIPKELLDGLDEDTLRLAAFRQNQVVERVRPATTPNTHRVALAPDSFGDFLTVQPLERQQDHPGSLGNPLGTGAGTRQSDQHLLLAFRDRDLRCPPWHSSSLLEFMEIDALQEGMAKTPKSWKIDPARVY
jgi:hypothetical protein